MTKNKTVKEFTIDSKSPYFLDPSGSSGAMTTSIKFNGKNYDLWEKAVRTALKAKNKLGFIDGSITKPTTDLEELSAGEIVNSMIRSWILNVIDWKLHTSVAYIDSAQEMWNNIQKRYAVPYIPRIHQLKAKIASCKQTNKKWWIFFEAHGSLDQA